MGSLWLALDAASPLVSAALAEADREVASAAAPARGDRSLLDLIDELFRATGRAPGELAAVVAVGGPGSFTGVRIGLATALGLCPPGEPRSASLFTISALAGLALQSAPEEGRILAVVDALRGECFHQRFERQGDRVDPIEEPLRSAAAEVALDEVEQVIAFAPLAAGLAARHLRVREGRALAPAIAVAASTGRARALLTEGARAIYLRAPAVTFPAPREGRT